MKNAINWFEIPVKNFERAKTFYETIFDAAFEEVPAKGSQMAFFPCDWKKGAVGGSLIKTKEYKPSTQGTIAYLNAGEDLNGVLGRVKKAGGKILKKKFSIGDHGFIAFFIDTEGNKVGLHSMK